ncbi:MAG: hypothetical protein LBR08_06085 [Bacteroidales bacterium]|nr:hypothetical protein [Bacteroidales bacterium]
MDTWLNTQEDVTAGSFDGAYSQTVTERTFRNGEIDGGMGLIYLLSVGEKAKNPKKIQCPKVCLVKDKNGTGMLGMQKS